MKTVLISRATDLVGTRPMSSLNTKGHTVRGFSLKEDKGYFYWNPKENHIDPKAF